jgi:phthalate 4,5-dioxygenase
MLTRDDNETLCRVGPGTPMGRLLRSYWIPMCLSTEVTADGPARKIRLLGEDLVAFRVTTGEVGLVEPNCPHRGAAMYYGRNEACGLRCPYHGWKFDVSGRCVDMPNEPMQSRFKERVRIASYRCVERLGVIWTYMGNRKEPPRLPVLEWNCNPNNVPVLWRNHRACNWVQAMEGDLDSSHVNFLHRILDPAMGGTTTPGHPLPGRADDFGNANMADASPRFEVQQTEFGLLASAIRDRGDGTAYHRVHPFLFPFHTMIGGRLGDDGNLTGYHGKAWVPMDDEQTLILEWHLRPDLPWTDEERRQIIQNRNPHGFLPDNTLDPVGGWKSQANAENAFFWDYEVQRTKLFFGVTSNPLQDGAIQESMGHICDRTKEHLGTTDTAIIQMRKRLLSAARGVVKGEAAPGVDSPDAYAIRPSGAILPVGADWYRSTEDKRRIPVGLLSNLKA